MTDVSFLFSHETEYLLEALRRDLRTELERAQLGDASAEWHRQNARKAVRLLEIINPRARRGQEYGPQRLAA